MAKLLCNYQLAVSMGSTVAEGIAVKTPGELTTQIAKHFVDDIVVVTEDMIEEAIALLLNIEKQCVKELARLELLQLCLVPIYF